MSIENLKRLEIHLLALQDDHDPKIGFNMGFFIDFNVKDFRMHICKTVCCIEGVKDLDGRSLPKSAQEFLELTDHEASSLFYPNVYDAWGATPLQAADAVKKLASGLPPWE